MCSPCSTNEQNRRFIMNNLSKEQLVECFKPFFKQYGFKKMRTTWRKSTDDFVFVLNIQGSQWSKEDYYINVGIYIKALGTKQNPYEYDCHIRSRIDEKEKSCSSICKEILDWFERYGDIQKLKLLRKQNNLPVVITVDAEKYLDEI
jgi:hypothetical protein